MYQTPRIERFGTLRELTQGKDAFGIDQSIGIGEDSDQPNGCTAEAEPGSAAACITGRS
ncbi:MAG TPA: lasso RiPP family leader peptide-containing protein [Gemmatimonadaceae bacterium]|nr:lasso RiPP family leader peptide-containing protein [Gemmatimonadaceae bacterium]